MRSFSDSYREAGVNIEAGYEGVKLMKKHVERTLIPGVVSDIGGFGGLFAPDLSGMAEPVLVSGTDGVGTKLRIAQLLDKHDTIGIDCVAMCVNDIICCGAKPLFFLDYIAIGKNEPEKVATLVSGVAEGCVQSGCALVGGETAEHPGMMPEDEYDLAGYATGVVDQDIHLLPSGIQPFPRLARRFRLTHVEHQSDNLHACLLQLRCDGVQFLCVTSGQDQVIAAFGKLSCAGLTDTAGGACD